MKKILSLLLALVMVLALAACGNDSEKRDDDAEETKGGSSINAATKGEDPAPGTEPTEAPSKPITITYDEATKTLTVSGNGAMKDYVNLAARTYDSCAEEATRIVVEEGCTHIGRSAFYDFPLVTELSLPDSLISIGDYAFERCSSLTEISLPRQLQDLGTGAFENCENLTKVTLYENIRHIYGSAFNGCSVECTEKDGIEYLGNTENPYVVALSAPNKRYEESYTIADTCLVLGGNLFQDAAMESIVIPDSVKHIGDGVFRNSGLCSVTLPKNLLTLGEECFKGIRGLTQIELPETVTSIGANAFKECYDLSTINLPGSLTEVGNNLFMATDLSEITFDGTLAQWEAVTKEESGRTVTIHCTDGDVEF